MTDLAHEVGAEGPGESMLSSLVTRARGTPAQ
jgi:hypothetical protein